MSRAGCYPSWRDVVRDLDEDNQLSHLEPIDVARGLVSIHDQLPSWVGRTQRLSGNAKRIRHLFKQAKDPNRLIFDDIPTVVDDTSGMSDEETTSEVATGVREGLSELKQAYPAMLNRLRETLLAELQVPNASKSMLAELRERAENIRELGGDNRHEAFIVRLARFEGQDADMENLAGMAVNKPPQSWVDADIDRAAMELAEMAQRFVRAEVFARVKGRQDKRHAMAVVVGMHGRPTPIHEEFDVADRDRDEVRQITDRLDSALQDSGEARRNYYSGGAGGTKRPLSGRIQRDGVGCAHRRKTEEIMTGSRKNVARFGFVRRSRQCGASRSHAPKSSRTRYRLFLYRHRKGVTRGL